MTHHQTLAAIAAKIIHTTVQLCRVYHHVKNCFFFVCVDMVQYTVEQFVFL
jgi:hypothetical protein